MLGGYNMDENARRRWLIWGGGVGVVLLAITIGWLGGSSSRSSGSAQTRGVPAGGGGYVIPAPTVPSGGGVVPSYRGGGTTPSAVSNPNVRWAWTPPPRLPAVPANWADMWEPEPPGVLLASINPVYHRAAYVEAVRPVEPEIPGLPDYILDAQRQADAMRGESTGGLSGIAPVDGQVPLANLNGSPSGSDGYAAYAAGEVRRPRIEGNNTYVWDPVHERWAIRTEKFTARGEARVGAGRP